MIIQTDFAPSGQRARLLDKRVHQALGESLSHIIEACRGRVSFDEAALLRLCAELSQGTGFLPATFANYYDLVPALEAGNEAEAERLFMALAGARPAPAGLDVLTLDDARLGADGARFARMMNDDPTADLGILPPTEAIADAFRSRLDQGLELLDRALPELSAEIRGIIRQIVIIMGDPTKAYVIDGGSHYQLWGALFLNGEHHPDPIAVVEVLAHECAHSLLFGFCTEEGLVDNEDEELFSSPLRPDPRPMDGIFHATFVSARMHWAMTHLAESPGITSGARDRALEAARQDAENFHAGESIVADHGRLTPLGRALMDEARGSMRRVTR